MSQSNTDNGQEIIEKIKKIYPSEEEKCLAIITHLGAAATMTLFLTEIFDETKASIPAPLAYVMAVTSTNMLSYFHADDSDIQRETINYPALQDLNIEQEEEKVRRKLKHLVHMLYELLKKEEMEYEP
jgi:hypothetical protein